MEVHVGFFGWDEDLQKEVYNPTQTEELFVQSIEIECPERDEQKA